METGRTLAGDCEDGRRAGEAERGALEAGRDWGRGVAELDVGRGAFADAGREGALRLVDGGREELARLVTGRSVVGRATRGALDAGRGDAERDLGRGGTTKAGTSKSSPKGSNGSVGALGRGIEEQRVGVPPAGTGEKRDSHFTMTLLGWPYGVHRRY